MGAAGLLICRAAEPGICGSALPGDDLEGDNVCLVGLGGLDSLEGTVGLGLPGI